MAEVPRITADDGDLFLIKLAREIAIDHHSIETILQRYGISSERWAKLQKNARFNELLTSETQAWQSAVNTKDRTELKAAAMMEEFLPEAFERMHNPSDNLSAKVELAKLIARIAGLGLTGQGGDGSGGERFSVTINLGADSKLKFEKELPRKVIDATPVE